MKVGVAQLNPKIGAVEDNLKKVLAAIEEAKANQASLLVFPELTFLGYPPRDLLEIKKLIQKNEDAAKTAGAKTQGMIAIFSVAETNPNPGEKPLFNVAQVWQNGKCVLKYKKRLFPYYDVFDEERHFEPGTGNGIFVWEGKKVALTICEDAWARQGFEWKSHGRDLISELKTEKPDLLLNLSASPFEMQKPERREVLFASIAKELKCPVIYCDQTGANDELIFDGSSFVLNENGERLLQLPAFQPAIQFWEWGKKSFLSPLPSSRPEWMWEALTLGVRDYCEKTGQKKAVLGLSGGIDSCVVLTLLCQALGSENVKAVALPTRFNSENSLKDAEFLCEQLGIPLQTLPIENLREAFEKTLPLKGVALENIQPRIRMTLLMGIANAENRILFNTSNKSELVCGYSTLYGDTAGALGVIGDLKKREVYDLAKYINRKKEIIPKNAIERPPSAELRDNQTDQDTLPAYDVVDKIVELFIEERLSPSEILKKGISQKDWETFSKLYRVSEYKRRQMPPILRVTSKAFGIGRRIPVAAEILH